MESEMAEGIRWLKLAVKGCDLIPRAEQMKLARRWRKRKDTEALNRLIESLVPWAVRRAKDYHLKIGRRLDLETLVSVAYEGLVEGMPAFDPERGVSPTTYIAFHIDRTLRLYYAENQFVIRLPVHLSYKPGRKATTRARAAAVRNGHLSITPDDGDFIPKDSSRRLLGTDTAAFVEWRDEQQHNAIVLNRLVERLSLRERIIIRSRFFEGKTLKAVGEELGITRERVRQIQAGALLRLRRWARGMISDGH
jgi:RNA polymerase sigma factor (sigma-70 family)